MEPVAGRNRSFRVLNPAGRGLFLKQAEVADPSAAATLAREAAFYSAVRSPNMSAAMRDRLPALVSWDPDRKLLILELVPDACNVHELDDADGAALFPRIGQLLGASLATMHGVARTSGLRDPEARDGGTFGAIEPAPIPWVLDVCRPGPEVLRDVSPAQLELTRQVQASTGVDDALRALRAHWTPNVLIHGDLKWGNVLARARAPRFEPERVWIVDWEFGGWGDPTWDLGSALHSFVSDCIHAAVTEEAATPTQVRATFDRGMKRAREQIRAMWTSYDADAVEDHAKREASVRAAGARLLQSAWEWSHGQPLPPRDAVLALQLAMNLLRASLPDAMRFLGTAGTDDTV
ncbi:MAG: phosphotransferase [Gemmatimonadaceae bacterium]